MNFVAFDDRRQALRWRYPGCTDHRARLAMPSNRARTASRHGTFAQLGPPQSDAVSGDMTVYSWKGGYKKRTVPAQYAEGKDGKKGKRIAPARTEFLSCSVQLTVSSDYVIRSAHVLGDRKTSTGPSWCEEFLAGDKAK